MRTWSRGTRPVISPVLQAVVTGVAEGVAMVRDAKARGLPVTCDIGIHHAHLSEMDIGYFDPNCHLMPPLRSQRYREALRAGLADGTIDAIATDHAPHALEKKMLELDRARSAFWDWRRRSG